MDRIKWELSEDKEELIIRIRVASLVSLVLDQHGDSIGRALGLQELAGRVLTDREKELMPLLLQGMPYKMIGAAVGTEARTVKFHAYNIFRKFHVHSRSELMMLNFEKVDNGGNGDEKKNVGSVVDVIDNFVAGARNL